MQGPSCTWLHSVLLGAIGQSWYSQGPDILQQFQLHKLTKLEEEIMTNCKVLSSETKPEGTLGV